MQEEIKEEQNTPNPGTTAPTTPETEMHMPETEPTPDEQVRYLGPIVGVLIVILVLILGGLYIWGSMLTKDAPVIEEVIPRAIENVEPETPRAEADTQILNTVSSSDEIDAIEADLESTDLDSLDAELEEIDRELEAALESI